LSAWFEMLRVGFHLHGFYCLRILFKTSGKVVC
jgi:hypothetical protein